MDLFLLIMLSLIFGEVEQINIFNSLLEPEVYLLFIGLSKYLECIAVVLKLLDPPFKKG